MYFKGKNIENQILLKGYIYSGDRKAFYGGKSILLYKRKINHLMVPAQFTISTNCVTEQTNYYILARNKK